MLRTFALVLGLFTASCTTLAPRHVMNSFVDAFNRLAAADLRPLLAEDATAFLPMPQHPELVRGRDEILAILAPLLEADRQRRNGQPLNLVPKDIVIQQHGRSAVVTFDVGTAEVHSRRTLVLERRGGRWMIIHLHASNVRP
ncbi:MAG: hypothetical protein DMF56_27685 [Acidobacteria bacterium]|nr:MAG: hypothetical protein DMF56_27685 [Acidobacteriota bacterium]